MAVRTEDGAELYLPGLGYKPLIGVVHLPPLGLDGRPGAPLEDLVEYAVAEASKLDEAGFDAVILENYGDMPYRIRWTGNLASSILAVIAREVRRATSLEVGVNVLRNDALAAAAAAYAAGARFIRVNSLCEVRIAPEGILEPVAAELHSLLSTLPRQLLVLADIDVKHSIPVADGVEWAARECATRGRPSALVASGGRTGEAPAPGYVASLRAASSLPVLVGSGVTLDNLAALIAVADGVIVGTWIKHGSRTESPIDPVRARRFAEKYKGLRRGDVV